RIAFRLFFGTVGESRPAPGSGASIAPVVASARQRAKFALMKLNEADQAVLASALSDFKSDFRKAMGEVSKANALAKVGTKPSSPPAALLDDVTQQTLDKLKNTMSPDGFQKLKDHVRSEKRNMKIIPLQMAMHK
ncbi:MAG TPA: hypothetical protein VGK64_07650, partial [Bryobacteraceae bacterium]